MNKKNTQRGLFYSVISLLLCVSMLVGTTLAWFSDSVSSTGNIIKTGRLDVTMEYANDPNGEWKDASEATIFSGNLWEPGYSDMKFIKVSNTGNLAFNYQMHILPAVQATGEVDLADVIDVYVGVVEEGFEVPAAFSAEMAGLSRQGTLAEVMAAEPATGILLPVGADGSNLSGADVGEVTYCVLLHMQETAGNEYQNLTVGNNFTIQLVATQMSYEQDSFGNSYDANAEYTELKNPNAIINEEVVAAVTVNEEQELVEEVKLEGDAVSAEVPAGVKLAEGVEALTLSVETIKEGESEANISLSRSEVATSLDVHMEGVAEDNTVPMVITLEAVLPKNLNTTSVELYHVENGETVQMTQVALAEVDAHNEFYYDATTGNVVLALASFSEIVTVADSADAWKGTAATAFAGGDGTANNPYQIANEEQFAYFRDQVDGGRSFVNEFVKLTADLNLQNVNFDPIGWGYVNASHNRDGIEGKVFQGTFDGDGHTISNLKQDGWDLEDATGTDYTYTNCGFGLFAAAHGATFKNLTISGAYIRVECVETGILVGLSQGYCIYDNIKVYNSKAANYQRPVGGLIGEVSPDVNGNGTTTINNVTIGSDVVVGSLWGDFDTPVGGVIGARWDDGDKTTVVMEDVTIACQLDVYSDVTAAYQWHTYRRAGMLIGNTDTPPADGKNAKTATADFLTCVENDDGTNTVKVYFGGWNDYHYCRFSNEENPGKNYPWVRVEVGQNNPAYSNPRYGHPVDAAGNTVIDGAHVHGAEDASAEFHNAGIPFKQMYGGGQGVYGPENHKNKTGFEDDADVDIVTYDYSVTYMDRGNVFAVDYENIGNSNVYTVKHEAYKPKREDSIAGFKGWVNAGGKKIDTISVEKGGTYIVYDSWHDIYTARFVNEEGLVIHEEEFTNATTKLNEPPISEIKDLPEFEESWESYNLSEATGDITIKPFYVYSGDLSLVPVDEEPDGITNYYKVVPNNKVDDTRVVIPGNVNGIPVTTVERIHNEKGGSDWGNQNNNIKSIEVQEGVTTIGNNGLAYTPNLTEVWLPSTLEYMGKNVFCRNGGGDDNKVLTIHYAGTKEDWYALEARSMHDPGVVSGDFWEGGLAKGTRVIFNDGSSIVMTSASGWWDGAKWKEE